MFERPKSTKINLSKGMQESLAVRKRDGQVCQLDLNSNDFIIQPNQLESILLHAMDLWLKGHHEAAKEEFESLDFQASLSSETTLQSVSMFHLNVLDSLYFKPRSIRVSQLQKKLLRLNEPLFVINLLTQFGTAARKAENNFLASLYYQSVLPAWQKLGSDYENMVAALFNDLGCMAAEEDKLDAAERYLNLSLNLRRKYDNRKSMASIYLNLARLELNKDNLELSFDYTKAALVLDDSIDSFLNVTYFMWEIIVGCLYRDNLSLANNCLDHFIKLSLEIKDFKAVSKGYLTLGVVAQTQKQWTLAKQNFERSKDIAIEHQELEVAIEALNTLTTLYKREGDYVKAIAYIDLAMKYSHQLANSALSFKLLFSRSEMALEQTDVVSALGFAKEAKVYVTNDEETNSLAGLFLTMALSYSQSIFWEVAASAYEQSWKLYAKLDKKELVAVILNSWGKLVAQHDSRDKAVELLTAAAEIFRKLDSYANLATCLVNLSKIHSRQKQYEKANLLLVEALSLHTQGKDAHYLANILSNLASLKMEQGQWKDAHHDFQQALTLYHTCNMSQEVNKTLLNIDFLLFNQPEVNVF